MSSILTNVPALAALQTLRTIDKNLEETQGRVSSGLKVQEAADNASYWAISTSMKSDEGALSTVVDALGLGAAKADTTYAGLNQSLELIKTIKNKLVTANETGVDKSKVGREIEELKAQLINVAQTSSFSGENWLYNNSIQSPGTKQMVGSFTRAADGSVSVQTIDFNANESVMIDTKDAAKGLLTSRHDVPNLNGTGTRGFYLLNVSSTTGVNANLGTGTGATAVAAEIVVNSSTSEEDVKLMLSAVEQLVTSLIDVAATIGAAKSRIDSQTSFVKELLSVLDKGIGQLVDAEMNEESTRLKALQTQQQLGIQSLSIANTNASNILQLFRQ